MLNSDYREMLSILNDEGVDYLVVGAYAMAVHGVPRATGDIDIFVSPTMENSAKVFRSLERFGAPLAGIQNQDFSQPGIVLQIGVAPCRIDLLTQIDGVTFEDARKGEVSMNIDGLKIPFLGLAELKQNKLATGRVRDRLDVELLEEVRPVSGKG